MLLTLTQMINFGIKEFDNNLKFNENGRKFLKSVESLREEEKWLIISGFSFSLFLNSCTADTLKKKRACFRNG